MFFVFGIKIDSKAEKNNQYAYVNCCRVLPDIGDVITADVLSRFTR